MKKIEIPQRKAVMVIALSIVVFVIAVLLAVSGKKPTEEFNVLNALSGYPWAVAKALLGCALLKLIDELMLSEINTMKLLKEDAKGYALYMLGYAVIIAWAFANA